MEEQDVVSALAAIAQTARLRVVRALVVVGPQGMTPGELSVLLGVPAPTLSFHLKALAQAKLIEVERTGRSLHYRAAFATMFSLVTYLTDQCCAGQTCIPQVSDCATPRRSC